MGAGYDELSGTKRRTSVLVRGFSALEIAKQIGAVPSYFNEAQFIASLKGDVGDPAVVEIGSTTTGAPGTDADILVEDIAGGVRLSFTLPRGAIGATGAKGDKGDQGLSGSGSGDLLAVQNLSDVANVVTARANLGLAKGIANGIVPLDGAGKIDTGYLPAAVLGALNFQTTWNANTNSPALPAAGAGNKGFYWIVTTAGATSQGGITDWNVGDWVVSDGVTYRKVDNTDSITSVAGLSGVISAASLRTALALAIADVSGLQAALDAKEAYGEYNAIDTETGDYTFVLTDKGKMKEGNKATPLTFTVPPNSSVAFPIKSRIDLAQIGAGQLIIAPGAGVTIRSTGGKLKIKNQYSGGYLYKRGTNEWVLIGNLSA